jgi:hypothetical protein
MNPEDPRDRLTDQQRQLMFALSRQDADIPAMAARFGISTTRLRRWVASPRFRSAMAAQLKSPWPDPRDEWFARIQPGLAKIVDDVYARLAARGGGEPNDDEQ